MPLLLDEMDSLGRAPVYHIALEKVTIAVVLPEFQQLLESFPVDDHHSALDFRRLDRKERMACPAFTT